MTDLNTCRVHMQTLGLKFPFTAEQEQQSFEDLVETHHPDFCDDDVCRGTNKPLIERIAEAHLYLREHGEKCHTVEREYWINFAKDFYQEHYDSDISGLNTDDMNVAIKVARILTELGED